MRVGPVGWLSTNTPCMDKNLVLKKAKKSATSTHNHHEGIKGAQAIALCIYLARKARKGDAC